MQSNPSNDFFYQDFQNRLKVHHLGLLDQTSTLNKLIDDTIQDYQLNKNTDRTVDLIQQLQEIVESIFSKLSENLSAEENDSLTKVCRRFNEDNNIWEIRDSHIEERFPHEGVRILPTTVEKEKMSSFVETYFPFGPTKLTNRESLSPDQVNPKLSELPQEEKPVFYEPLQVIQDEQQVDQNIQNQSPEKTQNSEKVEPEQAIIEIISEELKLEIDNLLKSITAELTEHKVDNAHDLLEKLRSLPKSRTLNKKETDYYQAKLRLNQLLISDVDSQFRDCQEIIRELEDENGYTVEGVKKNFTIKYKQASGQNISLKMEGIIDVPVFNMIALIYEMEGYSLWMPFCKEGKTVKSVARASKAGYIKFNIPPPVFDRENYIYGSGFDRIKKNGSILICAKSIEGKEDVCQRYDIPIPPPGKTTRLHIEYMGGEFTPVGKDKMRMNIVCKVDLKIKFIPLSIINWIVRKAAQFLIDRLIKKATNFKGTLWEKKIQENREFYGWLEAKINEYLDGESVDQQQKVSSQ